MSRLVAPVKRFRNAYMLAALVLLLFVGPFLPDTPGFSLIDVLLFLTLVGGVLTCADRRAQVAPFLVFVVVATGLRITSHLVHGQAAGIGFFATAALACLWATAIIGKSVFVLTKRVTANTICAALSVYLLLGLGWAFAYAILQELEPGAYQGITLAGKVQFERFIGFSFTTLTTLGYGNVAPTTPKADALCTFQAVIGQIYIAVMVARLVAVQVSQSISDQPATDQPAA